MKRTTLAIATLTTLFFASCIEPITQDSKTAADTAVHATATRVDSLITAKATDKKGKVLNLTFNNTKNTATVVFEGATIELESQMAGSGFAYANKYYELRGKGDKVTFKKGKTVLFNNW